MSDQSTDDPAARAAAWADWLGRAHPAQRPPEGAWATWLFLGGRGAGKTRAGAQWLLAQAVPGARLALLGPSQHEVRTVMVEGVSGILACAPDALRPDWESSRRRLRWGNGAEAHCFSAEDPDGLRGPQFHAAWGDEVCAWGAGAGSRGEAALANLRLALRLAAEPGSGSTPLASRGGDAQPTVDSPWASHSQPTRGSQPTFGSPWASHPRLLLTTTPRPTAALRRLRAETTLAETRAPTLANAAHLAPDFIAGLEAIYGGTRLAAQELEGQVVEAEGGLWTAAGLAACRGPRPQGGLERIVVAVDPPAGAAAAGRGESGRESGRGGSACGIVVAGRIGERAYVLADRSVTGLSPQGWAERAAAAARDFSGQGAACALVAEANQGGDMVAAVLKAANVGVPVRLVRATLSKRVRAEPIAALYEQGRVTHCTPLPELEEQLMALGGEDDPGARTQLDRADALVWALTTLMLEERAPPRIRVL